jgi:predicted GH43/DUF377 family glycosyl hydrolase
MRGAALLFTLVSLVGCRAGYGRFELPAPPPGPELEFRWEVRPEPVLARGPDGWDSSDALNPSVVRFGGEYLNLYSGFDGRAWHTGLARSKDGFVWQKTGRVLSPDPATWEGSYIAANGSALVRDGRIWYWYQAGSPPRIGVAISADARLWRKEANVVLDRGLIGGWDEMGIGDPYVIGAGSSLYLFYVGMDRARRQRLGVAQSTDGVHWTKLLSNPILEMGPDGAFDENGLGEPAVWASSGRYWMLYTGRDRHENRRIGLAESPDGVRWVRSVRAPVLSGEQSWDDKVVCDPTVLAIDGGWHVWFGGGNVARPDERLNGQIGYAHLVALPKRGR